MMIRCTVCSFIGDSKAMEERCPACGALKKALEKHEPGISRERRRVLDWKLHPILVHFPMAMIILAVILTPLSFVVQRNWSPPLIQTVEVLLLILPFVTLASIFSGRMDAQFRFRRLNSPYLYRKMQFSVVLFLLTLAAAWQMMAHESIGWIVMGLLAAMTVCALFLGRIGGQLLCAFVPEQRPPEPVDSAPAEEDSSAPGGMET